jgi:hypothetical protein
VGRVTEHRAIPDVQEGIGEKTVQTGQYYISSGGFSAEELLKYIRGQLADREPVALDAGQDYFGKTNAGYGREMRPLI